MSYFIDDLKTYLVDLGLMTTDDAVEGFDEANGDVSVCLYTYDNDGKAGKYSIQIMARGSDLPTARDKCTAIYDHFFNAINLKSKNIVINTTKCLFKPLNAPLFLKNENNYIYYTSNIEVWSQKL